MLANIVNGANIRMIQRGSGLRLALEAIEGGGIFGNSGREETSRDEAVQACVFRFVHDSHTAAADFLDDAIVRDGLADERVVRDMADMLGGVKGQVNEGENSDQAQVLEYFHKRTSTTSKDDSYGEYADGESVQKRVFMQAEVPA